MTINNYRLPGEAAAHPDVEKESATAGNRGAADRANQTDRHSTVEHSRETERERGEYLPLAWARLGGALIEALAYLALGAWAAAALWLLEVLP